MGLDEIKRAVSRPFSKGFIMMAKFITNFSPLAMFVVLLVLGLCSIGWVKFEIKDDVFYWNSPESSTAYKDQDHYNGDWGIDPRVISTFIDSSPGVNIIANNTLLLLLLQKVMLPITQLTTVVDGKNVTLGEVCAKTYPVNGVVTCQIQSIWSAWNYNATALLMDPSPLTTINKALPFVNSTMGNKKFDPNTGYVVYADSLRIAVQLNRTTDDLDTKAMALENQFDSVVMPNVLASLPYPFDIWWMTSQSPAHANADATSFSHWYYAISAILVTFVSCIYFGKADPVHSNIRLAIECTGLLYFAIFAGMGLGVGIQTKGAPSLLYVLPFLASTTGMNNIYMIYSLYSFMKRRDGLDDPKALVENVFAKSHARLSISLVFGFLGTIVGTQTKTPLVRYLARASMCTIFITWFATVIGTGVILYWDAVREAAGRYDLVPMLKGEVKSTPMLPRYDSTVKHLGDHSILSHDTHQHESYLEKFLRKIYIPNFIRAWPLQILIVLGFFAMWAVGAHLTKEGTNTVRYDQVFDVNSMMIRGVNELPTAYYEIGNGFAVRVPLPIGIDYSNASVQAQVNYLTRYLQTSQHTTGAVLSWWAAFQYFLKLAGNQTMGTGPVFYGQLQAFLNTSPFGNIYGGDIDMRNGTIYKTRFTTFTPLYMDLVYDSKIYNDLHKDVSNISDNFWALNGVYVTTPPATLYEGLLDSDLIKEAQFISALIMVVIALALAFLYKSWVAIFVGINIVGAYLLVFGFIYIVGYGIGFTRSMTLALATGENGNTSAIWCFEYQRAPGEDGVEKAQFAFTMVGSYIYHITLVGIVVCAILYNGNQNFVQIASVWYCCVLVASAEAFFFLPSIVALVERVRRRKNE